MNPSHPAPISSAPRKLRSDSKLSALPPEDQSLLLQKLETQSYQETAAWLHDSHGISVSPSNLSIFRSRHLENEALKEAYLQAATVHCTLQDLKEIDPGDAQVEAAVRRLFLFKVVNQGDIATYLHFTRVGNESKKLALTQSREERLQQERQDAHGGFQDDELEEDDRTNFTSPAQDRSRSPLQPLSLLVALHQSPEPGDPRSKSRAGAGTSRPHAVPPDSNHSKTPFPESSADSNPVPPVAPPNPESQVLAPSPIAPASPTYNSPKYPKIPAIQSTKISPPDGPATFESASQDQGGRS